MASGVLLLAFLLATGSASSSKSPTGFERIAKQADTARAADRIHEAVDLYRRGLRLKPAWREGWWSLASLYYDQDRFSESEDAFRHFAALAPEKGPADAFLGLCEYETRDYGRALQHFRRWASADWPGTPELRDVAVFHFALLLTRNGEFVRALYLIAPEVAKAGENPALAEAMGLASLRMRNLPEDYPPGEREMVWLAGEAAIYEALQPRDFARSQEYAERLESRYPQEPEVHYFRGTLFSFESKNDDAEHEYRKELQISPHHVSAMLALAGIDLDKNELVEADAFGRKAVELEPSNPEAHHALGRSLVANGQLEASARELEIAKQLAPDNPLVRSHLAMVYGRLGRIEQAKAESDAFLRLKSKESVLAPPQEKLKSIEPANVQ
jgi:tetratricopeptide (TPR) repeat protein